MARIEPTAEQLHQALRQVRRSGWPDDFDACMANPLQAALVRAQAVRTVLQSQQARTGWQRQQAALLRPQQPIHRPAQPAAPLPARAALLDRKSAAAGEREDPDE